MIVSVQIISKVLATKDYSLITDNLLTEQHFSPYEEEFRFIKDHYEKYGNVPDEISFLDKFPEFELQEVTESDSYLVYHAKENNLFQSTKDVLERAAELLETDANDAVELLRNALATELQSDADINDEGVVETVDSRVQDSKYINQNPADWFIPTGFDEIDADINGLQRGDELVVIFARTNHGKSWILEKMCASMAESGYKVGYFSPEMSLKDIGYRFDSLHGHVSNNAIRLGRFNDDFTVEDYEQYAEDLKGEMSGELYVTKPKDFARKVTVSKLRNWILKRELNVLAIDGITYLTDERYKRGDSKTISLTNISEDLIELSDEMNVPILVVVQANRGGVVEKKSLDTPELENIRDSDGIAQNATIVYAVRQLKDANGDVFALIDNKKMRGGVVGQSYKYRWNIDIGEFECVTDIDVGEDDEDKPTYSSAPKKEVTGGKVKKHTNEEDVF